MKDNQNYSDDRQEPIEPLPLPRKNASARRSSASRQQDDLPRNPLEPEEYYSDDSAPTPPPRRRRSKRNAMKDTLLIVAGCLICSIGLAFYGINVASDLFGLNQQDQEIQVTIPQGASSGEIARLLGKSNVIDHPAIFRLYASLRKYSADFKSGTYLFNSNMGYDQIMIALRTGTGESNIVRITFYEGMSQREIADLLEEKGVCSASEFHSYLETAELDYEFMRMLPEENNRFRPYEGYLFPDTYDFYQGEAVRSVAKKFFDRFQQVFTDELYAQMQDRNMTLNETITLASIIQEECSDNAQMRAVSSVFHNRLGQPGTYPKLQSDVTIFYVNQDIKPFLDIADQNLYDSYNTYVCDGLPVGPICSPGLEAIEAALNPQDSNYYFFLTDSEGTFYYAETFQEHQQNIAKAKGDSHGVQTQ